VIFNEKNVYKDLLTERSTSKKDLGMTSRTTPGHQDAAMSEFVELDNVPVKKVQSILKGNKEL